MRWADLPFHPSDRTLRQFAGLWIVFFAGLGLWQLLGRQRLAAGLALEILAFAVGPVGLVRPRWLRPVFVGWMVLAFPIGWLVSHLMLAVLYYGIFTPLGLAFRLAGRDALALRPRPDQESYWSPKPAPEDVRRYFRQF